MQNPSELQQDPCLTQQNLNKTYAEPIRISTKTYKNLNKTYAEPIRTPAKPMQNPSESQQNICRIHQNLNKTHAESIRISTIPMQDPSELQRKPIRIPTIPMQNPSELQQFIRIPTQSVQNPSEIQQKSIRILTIPYAESIRTSTKTHQNLNNTYAESINKNPSESQQNPCITPSPSQEAQSRPRRSAARFRLLAQGSIDSYSHSAAL